MTTVKKSKIEEKQHNVKTQRDTPLASEEDVVSSQKETTQSAERTSSKRPVVIKASRPG
jgi:hypothetical protein